MPCVPSCPFARTVPSVLNTFPPLHLTTPLICQVLGPISSQHHFLLPGWGRGCGVPVAVHAYSPQGPWAPPSSDYQLSMHGYPHFMLCPLRLPPISLGPFPTSPPPHSCVPSFSAESELEKEQWLEAMQGAIAEALSTSEVAERIWAMAPNRFCADCGAAQPDWASINLCVVICKRCAGMKRAGCQARARLGWGVQKAGGLFGGVGAKAVSESIIDEVVLMCRAFPTMINLHGRDSTSHVAWGL